MASSMRQVRVALPICLFAVALTSCGDVRAVLPGSGDIEPPPPVTVHYGAESVALNAYAYCFGNGCSDGVPPTTPPDVGSPAKVRIDFPLDDWSFEATFTAVDKECGRAQTIAVKPSDDDSLILTPVGHASTYDVTLFGRGDGDLITVFRWSTPADGPLSDPEAQLAVLANHDGEVDSYGVELEVSNLASTPEHTTATITVTAANNRSLTFEATPSTQGCLPEGTVAWDGPDSEGLAAAQLGPRPVTYRVVLTLDDARHVATALWPRDEIRGTNPTSDSGSPRHCRRCDRNPENRSYRPLPVGVAGKRVASEDDVDAPKIFRADPSARAVLRHIAGHDTYCHRGPSPTSRRRRDHRRRGPRHRPHRRLRAGPH